jgi:UDP-glucose 6-dehydrogenase
MTYITEDEEKQIDDKCSYLLLHRGDSTFKIFDHNIFCYGEIDFNNDSDDMRLLDSMPILEHLKLQGAIIPADYDYDNHTGVAINKAIRYTETFHPDVLCKYVHGCLGKPKRVLIFKTR